MTKQMTTQTMISMKKNYKNWLVALLSATFAMLIYKRAPETIPIHFDFSGTVNDYGSKLNLFLFPGIIILNNLLAELLRRIDPKKENLMKFEDYYYLFFFMFNLFLFAVQVVLGAYILKWISSVPPIIEIGLGLLFIVMGKLSPKIKFNYTMGIRTPWALNNEDNWEQTHRFGGKVWMAVGILLLFSLFLPADLRKFAFLVVVMGGVFVVYAASFYFFTRSPKDGEQ